MKWVYKFLMELMARPWAVLSISVLGLAYAVGLGDWLVVGYMVFLVLLVNFTLHLIGHGMATFELLNNARGALRDVIDALEQGHQIDLLTDDDGDPVALRVRRRKDDADKDE